MAYVAITDAEIAPLQPITFRLLKKFRDAIEAAGARVLNPQADLVGSGTGLTWTTVVTIPIWVPAHWIGHGGIYLRIPTKTTAQRAGSSTDSITESRWLFGGAYAEGGFADDFTGAGDTRRNDLVLTTTGLTPDAINNLYGQIKITRDGSGGNGSITFEAGKSAHVTPL